MVITVDSIPTRTAEAIGQNPLRIIGISMKNINATVAIIDKRLYTPFFLPIARSSSTKSADIHKRAESRFISAMKNLHHLHQ